MIKKVNGTRLYVYSIGLIISSALERTITFFLDKFLDLNSVIYHVLSLIILVFLFILTNIIIKPLANTKFITKIALGKYYIGGFWLEIVINENNEISHITKINISYDLDEIKIHGNCFKSFQHAYFFDSICSKMDMDKYQLSYYFIAEEGNANPRKDVGYLCFDPNTMNTYSGHFEDKGKCFKVVASLIKDKKIITLLATDFEATFSKVILPDIIKKFGLTDIKVKKNRKNTQESSNVPVAVSKNA